MTTALVPGTPAPRPKTRSGRVAAVTIPQSRQDVETCLARLCALRGLLDQRAAILEQDVARLQEAYAAEIEPIERDIAALEAQIQAYCEAHRATLTRDGRGKTVKFANGSVSWKDGKPRVMLTAKEEAIIAALKKLRLAKAFVRVAESIDKQAILKAPERIAKVAGLRIEHGPETFAIAVIDVHARKERV